MEEGFEPKIVITWKTLKYRRRLFDPKFLKNRDEYDYEEEVKVMKE